MGLFRKRADRPESDPPAAEEATPGIAAGEASDAAGPATVPGRGGHPTDADARGQSDPSDAPTTAMAWSAPGGSAEPPLLARPAGDLSPGAPPDPLGALVIDRDSPDPAVGRPASIDPADAPTELAAPLDQPVEVVAVGLARPEPALQAIGLGVAADGRWVFAGVEVLVRRATVAAVVGPQGSGRSSLLLAVTGRMAVTAGTAAVAGVLVTTDAPAVRAMTAVARLGDVVGLESTLTVTESVDERCLIDGVSTSAGRIRFAEAARVLGLAVPEYLLVRDLTQEEATLLAVAVACVRPSDLIVLDDLDRGLNGPAQHRVVKALSRLALVGPAILITTTDGWPVRPVVAAMVTLPPRDRTPLLRPVAAVVVVPAVGPDGTPLPTDPSAIDPPAIDPPAIDPPATDPSGDRPAGEPAAAVLPAGSPAGTAGARGPVPVAGPIVADPAWAPPRADPAAPPAGPAHAAPSFGPESAPPPAAQPPPFPSGRHAARPAFPADPPAPAAGTDSKDLR